MTKINMINSWFFLKNYLNKRFSYFKNLFTTHANHTFWKKKKRMKNVAFGVVGANIYWALSA